MVSLVERLSLSIVILWSALSKGSYTLMYTDLLVKGFANNFFFCRGQVLIVTEFFDGKSLVSTSSVRIYYV